MQQFEEARPRLIVMACRLMVGCVLALVVAACSSNSFTGGGNLTPAPNASAGVYPKCPVGKNVTVFDARPSPGFAVDVQMTITQHEPAANLASGSPSADEYEVAAVIIKDSKGSYAYSATNFMFVTNSGRGYRPVDQPAVGVAFGRALGSGTLRVGQTVSGTVTFAVPRGGGHVGIYDDSRLELCGWPATT